MIRRLLLLVLSLSLSPLSTSQTVRATSWFIVIASRLNHDNWLLRKEKGMDHVLRRPLLAESGRME